MKTPDGFWELIYWNCPVCNEENETSEQESDWKCPSCEHILSKKQIRNAIEEYYDSVRGDGFADYADSLI